MNMLRSTWVAVALLAVTSGPAWAADADAGADGQAFADQMRALNWVKGPTTVEMQGNSKLTIPDQYVYLDAGNTRKFLELQHNLGDGQEVMVAPQNMEWMAYLEFSDEGYVKDNEKIDAPMLLKTLQSNTVSANAERRRRGWFVLFFFVWVSPLVFF